MRNTYKFLVRKLETSCLVS